MLAEVYRNIHITYENHKDVLKSADSMKEIKTFLNPIIDSVERRMQENKITGTTYTFPKLNKQNHIVIYVNPDKYDKPKLLFYNSHTDTCSLEIPYGAFLHLKEPYTQYEFEEKCLGIDLEKFKKFQTQEMTSRIEKILEGYLPLHDTSPVEL